MNVTCPICEGSCVVDTSTASHCTVPISRCCGGCSHDEACSTCDGLGDVEVVRCARCGGDVPAPLAVDGREIAPELELEKFCPGCAHELLNVEAAA